MKVVINTGLHFLKIYLELLVLYFLFSGGRNQIKMDLKRKKILNFNYSTLILKAISGTSKHRLKSKYFLGENLDF